MPFFEAIAMQPDDPACSIKGAYSIDPRKSKVNLADGDYVDANGCPIALNCAKKAERMLLSGRIHHTPLPVEGNLALIRATLKLIFGDEFANQEAASVQTLGGTHALGIAAGFIAKQLGSTVHLSSPTWQHHKHLFKQEGLSIDEYAYYDPIRHGFNFEKMCVSIKKMKPGDVIVLQPSCHNPTGIDPSSDQWKELSALIQKQNVLPLFDISCQGLGKGIDQDVEAVRIFAKDRHEMLIAYTFSKNMELSTERVGIFAVMTRNLHTSKKIKSYLHRLLRNCYTNPPSYGAQIISTILQSEELYHEWEIELSSIRDRLTEMRKSLISNLLVKGACDFTFLNEQRGLFSFCGLDRDQIHRLRQENGIYVLSSGNINLAGLNWNNIDYVAEAVSALFSF